MLPSLSGDAGLCLAAAVLRALVEIVVPGGLDESETRRALGYVTASATVDGRRYDASLTRNELTIDASPAVKVPVDWLPDPSISTLTYDFQRARFEADGAYANLLLDIARPRLRHRVPEAMRIQGYDPFLDPKLEANLERLIAELGASGSAANISTARVSFGVILPRDVRIPLGDSGEVAVLKQGTRAAITFTARGTLADPSLESLRIAFSPTTKVGRGLAAIDIHAVTVRPGGQVELDYDLGPERVVDGLRALAMLTAIAAEPNLARTEGETSFEPTRIDGFRAKVRETVDGQVEPALRDLIRAHEGDVPGFSLLGFFGIE